MDNWKNKLFFGDNLEILREHIKDETIDLIYLDPPFNSKATYNVLYSEKSGQQSTAQIIAFEDFWKWGAEAEATFVDIVKNAPEKLSDLIVALRKTLGQNDMMAYLVMMTIRLLELHRALKPTGAMYLHCDAKAAHYLKIILDAIFGAIHFRNHITWVRSTNPKGSQHKAKRFSVFTDSILFYAKTKKHQINLDRARRPLTPEELKLKYDRHDDIGQFYDGPILRSSSMGHRPNLVYEYKGFTPGPAGWRMSHDKLQELDKEGNLGWAKDKGKPFRKLRPEDDKGIPVSNVWNDIPPINSQAAERLGYPTQKPEALLHRIISVSSEEGDLVLDPFCGCGTSIAVSERLKRRWIGIDITHLAVTLMKNRLETGFSKEQLTPYVVVGAPKDLESAKALALQNRYQFEYWAIGLVSGRPARDRKKGGDTGIDGIINFFDDNSLIPKKIIIQVKSGKILPSMIRDLKSVVDREEAVIGAFVTLETPTKGMVKEALSAGFYTPEHFKAVPKIQILTIDELVSGKRIEFYQVPATFKPAQRKYKDEPKQETFI